jgi:hypothetical protein
VRLTNRHTQIIIIKFGKCACYGEDKKKEKFVRLAMRHNFENSTSASQGRLYEESPYELS